MKRLAVLGLTALLAAAPAFAATGAEAVDPLIFRLAMTKLKTFQKLHHIRIECLRMALMRHMSADGQDVRVHHVGQRLCQLRKRGRCKCLVTSAPQEQSRLIQTG